MGRSWELDSDQRLQQPSSSRCTDLAVQSIVQGTSPDARHGWPLVHERHFAFMHVLGQQRIATGRTSDDSVTRHRMIRRRRVCYVKTLAAGRVLSDANERARSLASDEPMIIAISEHIIDGRIGPGGHAELGTLPLCGPSPRWVLSRSRLRARPRHEADFKR